jgi:hypothetical protein
MTTKTARGTTADHLPSKPTNPVTDAQWARLCKRVAWMSRRLKMDLSSERILLDTIDSALRYA